MDLLIVGILNIIARHEFSWHYNTI